MYIKSLGYMLPPINEIYKHVIEQHISHILYNNICDISRDNNYQESENDEMIFF